jgi:hypothetical protein
MDLIKKRLFILVFLLFLAFFIFIFFNMSSILIEEEFPIFLKVEEIAGFEAGNILSFGTVSPGLNASRSLMIKSNYSFPVVAFFNSEGNISSFLIFDEKIKIKPYEEKIILISATVPFSAVYGNYSGKFKVYLKKDFFLF